MPNWVKNEITFEGKKENIEALLNAVKSDESDFDFNKLIPMPESLNLISGSITEDSIFWALSKMSNDECAKYFNLLKNSKDVLSENRLETLKNRFSVEDVSRAQKNAANYVPNEDEKKLGITDYESLGRMYLKNLEEYGTMDWYDWHCKYWGTKWNTREPVVKYKGDGKAEVYFETAWSHPLPVMVFLAMYYPDVKITIKYADEDLGYNCGMEIFHHKKMKVYEFENAEALKFACDIWGYSPEDWGYSPDEDDSKDIESKISEYALIEGGTVITTQAE